MGKKPKDIPLLELEEDKTPFQRFERMAKHIVSVPKSGMKKSAHTDNQDRQ